MKDIFHHNCPIHGKEFCDKWLLKWLPIKMEHGCEVKSRQLPLFKRILPLLFLAKDYKWKE